LFAACTEKRGGERAFAPSREAGELEAPGGRRDRPFRDSGLDTQQGTGAAERVYRSVLSSFTDSRHTEGTFTCSAQCLDVEG